MDEEIQLSRHAIERYRERVRPAYTSKQAGEELRHVLLFREVTLSPPLWLGEPIHQGAYYALVGPDIAFPMRRTRHGFVTLTCLTRGSLAPEERKRRKQKAKARRFRRHAHRRKWHDGHRPQEAAA